MSEIKVTNFTIHNCLKKTNKLAKEITENGSFQVSNIVGILNSRKEYYINVKIKDLYPRKDT